MSFDNFGTAARKIKSDVAKIATEAHLSVVYLKDTPNAPGQADYDILQAAEILELAASDLRILHERIQQKRADQQAVVQ